MSMKGHIQIKKKRFRWTQREHIHNPAPDKATGHTLYKQSRQNEHKWEYSVCESEFNTGREDDCERVNGTKAGSKNKARNMRNLAVKVKEEITLAN